MRITHYLSRFQLADGGIVRTVLDICALLAQRGHETTLITRDATDVPKEGKTGATLCPKLVEVGMGGEPGSFFNASELAQIEPHVRSTDILHVHTPWDRANRQFSTMCVRLGKPYIITVHGMLDDWSMSQRGLKKRLYLALGGKAVLERSTFVHCTAQSELEQAQRWFPRGRGCVIPCVFDLAPFRVLPGPEAARRAIPSADTDEPIVLFLSRVHEKKRPEVVIDAAAILRDAGERFRVLIAGTGDDRYIAGLKDRVARLNLADRVCFVGLVVGTEKISLYQRADVFVLPTSQENFGLVYTEALACGTPVVATKGTDIWRELEASGGAIIAPGAAQPTADAIRELLHDPARCRAMGAKGRAWVFANLDGEHVIRRYEEMYAQAARGVPHAPRER